MVTRTNKPVKTLFGFLCLLFLSIGCGPETIDIMDPTNTTSITPPNTTITPPTVEPPSGSHITTTSIITATVTPTTISSPETPIPTVTDEPEPLKSVSPLPTIPNDEVESFVLELIRGNDDCHLPCWWGATPGQSLWSEAQPFLSTFAEISSMPIDGEFAYFVQIFIPDKENPAIVYGGTYQVRDDVIVSIQTGGGEQTDFFLPQLLNKYGVPDEVWLNTYSRTLMGVLPFRLTLVYKSGFVITYSVQNATVQADSVVGCFDQTAPNIWLVSPDRNITFEESIQDWSSQIDADQTHLPLQEATDLSIPEFYEQFNNPDNAACLETSANLWP